MATVNIRGVEYPIARLSDYHLAQLVSGLNDIAKDDRPICDALRRIAPTIPDELISPIDGLGIHVGELYGLVQQVKDAVETDPHWVASLNKVAEFAPDEAAKLRALIDEPLPTVVETTPAASVEPVEEALPFDKPRRGRRRKEKETDQGA